MDYIVIAHLIIIAAVACLGLALLVPAILIERATARGWKAQGEQLIRESREEEWAWADAIIDANRKNSYRK